MATLKDIILAEGRRPLVVSDCVRLIDDEVSAKSGLTGLAVKGGYAIVKKIKPGIIPDAVEHMLDDFVDKLEPFYAEFLSQGGAAIEPYFKRRDNEIANALLGVTDSRAARSSHNTLKKAYEKLRPTGIKHTAAAVPGLARLIAKHT
ncbi:MAG: hypothetical protein A2289_16580 [Deltaproteobacteria bacterium RIFOXYA12_FULL_58_15]|nr:MAG: hypothetical protein A2289_16580 [Deltaproteobacteria bacterium RIFOXYA12_FULL_58_15]OGR10944.1 MAG: hypothetical protein A2341_11305 [Deltaproteobacteria bacterium RIFOXYB12_FULL_58_9]